MPVSIENWVLLELAYRFAGAAPRPWVRPLRFRAGAAGDHFLQFVLVARTRHGRFHRDLLLEIGRGQCLVERLHPELVLTGLHRRINLVNLVFADQVADGRIGNHNLHDHGAAFAVRPSAEGFGT